LNRENKIDCPRKISTMFSGRGLRFSVKVEVTRGKWHVAGDRGMWQVVDGKKQVASGTWQVDRGKCLVRITLEHTIAVKLASIRSQYRASIPQRLHPTTEQTHTRRASRQMGTCAT
jgi:hypothetical protein